MQIAHTCLKAAYTAEVIFIGSWHSSQLGFIQPKQTFLKYEEFKSIVIIQVLFNDDFFFFCSERNLDLLFFPWMLLKCSLGPESSHPIFNNISPLSHDSNTQAIYLSIYIYIYIYVCVCVCVCVRERERESKRIVSKNVFYKP